MEKGAEADEILEEGRDIIVTSLGGIGFRKQGVARVLEKRGPGKEGFELLRKFGKKRVGVGGTRADLVGWEIRSSGKKPGYFPEK